MPCIKIYKPLVVYRFSNVMIRTLIRMLRVFGKSPDFFMLKKQFHRFFCVI